LTRKKLQARFFATTNGADFIRRRWVRPEPPRR
jgi:hypothetical protein